MAKKKTGKALKAIEKDVKKALHKGATERGIGRAVNRAIKKDAARKAADKKQTHDEATGQEQTAAEATEPAPRRVMTRSAKKKLVSFTAERWRIVKEAGLDPGGRLPSSEMLEKAKKILASRQRSNH